MLRYFFSPSNTQTPTSMWIWAKSVMVICLFCQNIIVARSEFTRRVYVDKFIRNQSAPVRRIQRGYMWPWVHRKPHLKYIHIRALSSLRPEPNDQFAVYDRSEREPIECIHPRNIVQYRVDRLNPAKWKRLCVCNAYMRTCGPRNRASYLLGLMDGRWPSLGWLVIIYHRLN